MSARRLPPLVALAGTALMLASLHAQAAGRVEVTWSEPEKYADIGHSPADRESALQALGAHLQKLARRLPDGQTLQLTVTDVDLAGEPVLRPAREVRILRGRADWPTMSLRYTLSGPAGTLRSGEARLSDMNYGFTSLRRPDEALGYEKRMIDTWFEGEFLRR